MKNSFLLILCFLFLFSGCSGSIFGDRNGNSVTAKQLIDPIEGRVDGWLFKTTVIQTSAPNPLSGLIFPGIESEAVYLKFKNRDGHIQAVDPYWIQQDDPTNPNDDLPTQTERVLFDLSGSEEGDSRADDIFLRFNHVTSTEILPFLHGSTVSSCLTLDSSRSINDEHVFDKKDLHWTFVNEVVYSVANEGICGDFVSSVAEVDTVTVRFRISFYRPKISEYQPLVLSEKSEVNEKFGVFQNMRVSRDEETQELQAKIFANRFDPMRKEPLVYYFHKGFPPKFKSGFQKIKSQTNQILADAGSTLRIDFKDYNVDGIERKLGDFRYNFVVWHESIDTTFGILGYGPASFFSETGEFISANLHVYNRGFEQYRKLIETFLEFQGAASKPDPDKAWDEISCEPGSRIAAAGLSSHLRSPLFDRIREVLQIPEIDAEDERDARLDLFPVYAQDNAAFLNTYHRVLPSLRFAVPGWNRFVHSSKRDPDQWMDWAKGQDDWFAFAQQILSNASPFLANPRFGENWISSQEDFNEKFSHLNQKKARFGNYEQWLRGANSIYMFDELDAIESLNQSSRLCKESGFWESDNEFRDRILKGVFFHVAIHELGHNLGLRHNFYGSVDEKHFRNDEISASVMDYAPIEVEFARDLRWGAYDEAALKWLYGNDQIKDAMLGQDFLYCTDEHRFYSPLCTAHDLGTTPTEIVLNHIEKYDSLYLLRNLRGERQFWDTRGYASYVYNAIIPLLRFWYLSEFSWNEDQNQIQELVKKLDEEDANREVLTEAQYNALAEDFDLESDAALQLVMAFYHAVVMTPSEDKKYQTEFDPFFGSVSKIGIALDKVYAMYAFANLHFINDYDPNVEVYAAMFDRIDSDLVELSERIVDDLILGNFEIFDWWKDFPLSLFSSAVHSPLLQNLELGDRASVAFDKF